MKRLHLIELEGLNIADLMTIKDREPNTTITVGGIDFYVDADQDILSTDGQGLLYFDHEDIEDIIFDLRSKNRIPAIRRRLEALKEALNSGHRLFVGGKNVDSFFTLKRETNISNEMVDMFDDGGKLPSFNNCQIMIVSGGENVYPLYDFAQHEGGFISITWSKEPKPIDIEAEGVTYL